MNDAENNADDADDHKDHDEGDSEDKSHEDKDQPTFSKRRASGTGLRPNNRGRLRDT